MIDIIGLREKKTVLGSLLCIILDTVYLKPSAIPINCRKVYSLSPFEGGEGGCFLVFVRFHPVGLRPPPLKRGIISTHRMFELRNSYLTLTLHPNKLPEQYSISILSK